MRVKACRYGAMCYFPHDKFIGASLETYGEYSELEVQFLLPLLRPGDSVIDAGANIGCMTLPFARAVGLSGRVYAYEPQRIVFMQLCTSLTLNAMWNVFPSQKGLSDRFEVKGVPRVNYYAPGNFGETKLVEDSLEMVALEPIDELSLQQCRLIKIDVQGMEPAVLAGAKETIKRCRPFLYVENDEFVEGSIREMRAFDYDLYWHLPLLFNPSNFSQVDRNIFGQTGSYNMFGIPKELGIEPHENLRRVTGPSPSAL